MGNTFTSTTATAAVSTAAPGQCSCTITVLDAQGAPKQGVTIDFYLQEPDGTDGRSFPQDALTSDASEVDGLITINLARSTRYWMVRGDVQRRTAFTVPNAAVYTLPELLGLDAA